MTMITRWLLLAALLLSACGGSSTTTRHEGPDVVTAEWTSGDDAPLGPPATP